MISFVVPISKNRLYMMPGILLNIEELYSKDGFEIIVVEQAEEEPFKLGQVRNIGFNKSQGDIIVIVDADIRFKDRVDFADRLEKLKRPFVCWNSLRDVKEVRPNVYELTNIVRKRPGHGGCIVATREQYEGAGGYSNLLTGWGAEDHIFCERSRMARINNELYHIKHPKQSGKFGVDGIATAHNRRMQETDKERDSRKDSFRQTICDEVLVTELELVRHYFVENIRVPDDFEYMSLYRKMRSLEND